VEREKYLPKAGMAELDALLAELMRQFKRTPDQLSIAVKSALTQFWCSIMDP
jgi:hypothetical protein